MEAEKTLGNVASTAATLQERFPPRSRRHGRAQRGAVGQATVLHRSGRGVMSGVLQALSHADQPA